MSNRIFDINRVDFEALAREVLAQGRSIRFRAHGGSMRPCIQNGDLLEVRSVQVDQVHIGAVLLFRSANASLFSHRVVQISQVDDIMQYLMQGDANLTLDGYIPIQAVLGKIISVERNGLRLNLDSGWRSKLAPTWAFLLHTTKRIYNRIRHWTR